jgi:glycosyltransferase involved in cell wall biosynthesis
MKMAIVEEWLVYGGAARVLEQVLTCFPHAALFATVDGLRADQREHLGGRRVIESPLRLIPGARENYRRLLPLMPFAVRSHKLADYDVVLSLNHSVANGALVSCDQLHLSYTHTPMRYAWDMREDYLRQMGRMKALLARPMLQGLRWWDARCATRIDHYAVNSINVAGRLKRCYSRSARVIYPPVDVEAFVPTCVKDDYYLTVSRLVPYKKIDLIAEAFSGMPDRRLIIVGDGPERGKVAAAAGPNVKLVPYQPNEEIHRLMREAKAFVYTADEDFGIVPVEAQASGTPVIAYAKGGVLETVISQDHQDPTGVLFHEQSPKAVRGAVRQFELDSPRFSAAACRGNALRFSAERFRQELIEFVETAWREWQNNRR